MKPKPGETHHQYLLRKLGDPKRITCTAGHQTFGGHCLNCGYKPVPKETK